MDVAWAYLMSMAPVMSNPAEFRENMIDLFYGEGSLTAEVPVEYDELRGKDGRMVRVPRAPKREADEHVATPREPVAPKLDNVPRSAQGASAAARLAEMRRQIEGR